MDSLDITSLRFRPKTNAPIENGRLIASSFEQLSESERRRISEAISPSLVMKLLGLSGYAAEASINSKDVSLIRSAIIFHVIEDFRNDYRENYRHLALIAHAAKVLGADLRSVVVSVQDIASERAGKYLHDFAFRDEGLNRLSSFGIRDEVVEGAFRFVPA